MSEVSLGMAFFGGALIGALFFGGLWWTIRRVQDAPRPAMTLLASSAARMVIALGGLYLVAWGRWERLLIAVAGFVIARIVVVHTFGAPQAASTEEVTPRGIKS
jgi:F1F0 ATPase subunit 2